MDTNEEALEALQEFVAYTADNNDWPAAEAGRRFRRAHDALDRVADVFEVLEAAAEQRVIAGHELPPWPITDVGLFQFHNEDVREEQGVIVTYLKHLAGPIGTCEPQPPGFPAQLASVPHRRTVKCVNWQPLPSVPAGL